MNLQEQETKWFKCCIASGVIIHLLAFYLLYQNELQKPTNWADWLELTFIFVLMTLWITPITLFLIAIPTRIAMNLMNISRRQTKARETLILLLTWMALGWMFYAVVFTRSD